MSQSPFTIKQLVINPEWEDLLKQAGLLHIEELSQREFDWFEAPNKRRGGWSGVTRIVLNPDATPESQIAVFLKIQQNHFFRSPSECFRQRLTFEREFDVLQRLKNVTSSIPEVALFASWKNGSDKGALLITKALDNWWPLRDWIHGNSHLQKPDEVTFMKALESIATTAREINSAGWVHLCYSAKHLFVQPQVDGNFRCSVIDFEKSRRHIRPSYRTIKDCSHFMRHTPNLTNAHKRHFLKSYFQTETFTTSQLKLIRKMRGAPKL